MPLTSLLDERLIQMPISGDGQVQSSLEFSRLFPEEIELILNGDMGDFQVKEIIKGFRDFTVR